ncbi:uncharacterized protein V6R79_022364 [Siganus canaliculatus]
MADREEDEELGQDKDINTSVDLIEDQQVPGQAEEESECPGCQSLGVLTLPCGHKLCPTCIELSQGEMAQTGCTICYGSQLLDSVLHSLLEALFHGQPRRPRDPTAALEGKEAEDGGMEKEEEALCLEHGEMLSVFCEEERELMCQQCQVQEHEEHQCCPTQEAVLKCKKELRSAIRSLQEQLETLTSVRRAWEDTAVYIKNYKKAFERVNCRAEEPEDESEILLDVAEHQSCVQHQAWDKMLKIIQYFMYRKADMGWFTKPVTILDSKVVSKMTCETVHRNSKPCRDPRMLMTDCMNVSHFSHRQQRSDRQSHCEKKNSRFQSVFEVNAADVMPCVRTLKLAVYTYDVGSIS